MADKPFTPGASCSTKQQSNIIYEKRGMAVWPHENKYEYQLFAVSPQGVFLLVKTPDRGPGSICGPLFNERENWRDFLSADSRLRRLILQVCGRDVRRDLIQARNDYVLDVALNKFQTEKEESKPFRFALSSSCEENVQQSVVSFQYENISEASDLSSRDNESGMSSKNEKKPNEYVC
ncbi:uncharacterized protein LOC134196137 [Corticium candelabrum]|uniref:uncharacterized protein LOC134196137 n=1 Tax=Corticium candelabrum TaxID=121492 RepID=UPI002E260A4D|nr:uncharacterized protein LOC134196137 [Corticium candelabrum]